MKKFLCFVLMFCSMTVFSQELSEKYVIVNVFANEMAAKGAYKINVDLGNNDLSKIALTAYKGDSEKKFKKFGSIASILNHFDGLGYDFVQELDIKDKTYAAPTVLSVLFKKRE